MEKTQTSSDEKIDEALEDSSGYEEVLAKSEELKKDYYKKKTRKRTRNTLPNFDMGTWMTGLTTGEVIDITLDEKDDVILEVRLNEGGVTEVRVRDWNGEYNDINEIVRLLEFMNIKEGKVSNLLGRSVPLKINRYALPSNELKNTEWRVYVPKKFDTTGRLKYRLDKILRYIGYEGEFQGKLSSLGFLLVSMIWWGLLVTGISTGIIATKQLPIPIMSTLFMSLIVSFILTVYTPMIMRGVRLLKEKYAEVKSKETVLEE
jgi:hypothetical protein